MSDDPIEPDEIVGPNDKPPEKPADGGDEPEVPQKRAKRTSFSGRQTPDQRKEETDEAAPFTRIALLGEDWWRGPGWQPSKEDQMMVQMLKFSGYTDEDIASALHMSVETLIKHFAFELRNAKTLIIGDLATRAYTRARQGNDIMTMFLLKTRSGGAFSEKAAQAQAITESLKDVEGMSDDKKAAVISSLVDLLNPKKEKAKSTTTTEDGQ